MTRPGALSAALAALGSIPTVPRSPGITASVGPGNLPFDGLGNLPFDGLGNLPFGGLGSLATQFGGLGSLATQFGGPAGPSASLPVEHALFGVLFSGVAIALGGALMKRGFDRRRERQLMAETPTEDVESLTIGPSEVVGTAVPAGEPIPAPFTEEACLVARWRVEEYYEKRDDKGRTTSGWKTVADGVEHGPFYVDDGTGRVLVEPDDGATFEVADRDEGRVDVGVLDRAPEAVRRFIDATPGLRRPTNPFAGLDFFGRTEGDRRYYQRLIVPGEEVYVYGDVRIRDGADSATNAENLVIRRARGDDRYGGTLFLISDRSERALRRDRRFALLWFPLGAAVTTAGVGGLLLVASLALGIDLGV